MSAWTGWANDVLADLAAPVTVANQTFLNTWHTYEGSSCIYNPLGTTLPYSGSTNCVNTGTPGVWVQNYGSPVIGALATAKTLESSYYTAIVAALRSGSPFNVSDPAEVAAEITKWGTANFAAWYLQHASQAGGPPAPGGSGSFDPGADLPAQNSVRAWHHHTKVLSQTYPAQLHLTERLNLAALKNLSRRK